MSSKTPKISHRISYRSKLNNLFKSEITASTEGQIAEITIQSNWAKYLCILTSGYLEQSVKEIIFEYISKHSKSEELIKYAENSWQKSRNFSYDKLLHTMGLFNNEWEANLALWFELDDKRKSDINSLVKWRNDIAHGNEANTTGITINSAKSKYDTVVSLVDKIESIVHNV